MAYGHLCWQPFCNTRTTFDLLYTHYTHNICFTQQNQGLLLLNRLVQTYWGLGINVLVRNGLTTGDEEMLFWI